MSIEKVQSYALAKLQLVTSGYGTNEASPIVAKRATAYFQNRLHDDSFLESSTLGIRYGRRAKHVVAQKLHEQSQNLLNIIGPDNDLFNDDRVSELWLSLAEFSLLDPANHSQFTLEFLRLLAGNKSSYNRGVILSNSEDAKRYCSQKVKKEKPIPEKLVNIYKHVDQDATDDLVSHMSLWTPDSILSHPRLMLGVTQQTEIPFNAMVLDVENTPNLHNGRFISPFQEIVGVSALAVAKWDQIFQRRTMLFPANVFRDLQSGDKTVRSKAEVIIGHEYIHTQESLRIGFDNHLGRIFDEAMAVMGSNGRQYPEVAFLMLYMHRVLLAQENINFLKLINNSFFSFDLREDFVQVIRNNFGPRALLLLFATRPQNYIERFGISKIPGINESDRLGSLLGILHTERSKIRPGVTNAFLTGLSKEQARQFMRSAKVGKMSLPRDIYDGLAKKAA